MLPSSPRMTPPPADALAAPPAAEVAPRATVYLVVRAHGLSAGEAAVAEALARRHLALAGAPLADPVSTATITAGLDGDGDLAAACGRAGGSAVVVVDLLRVSSGIVVTLAVRGPDGALLQRHDSLAADLDHVHPVLADLARATVQGGLPGAGAALVPPASPRRPAPPTPPLFRTAVVAGVFVPVLPEVGAGASLGWAFRRAGDDGLLEVSVGGAVAGMDHGPAFGGAFVDVGGGRPLAGERAWVLAGGGGRLGGWGAPAIGAGLWTLAGLDLDPGGHAFLQARAGADVYLPADDGPTAALTLGAQVGARF